MNVLAAGDEALSGHFAKQAPDKFARFAERFVPGLGGVPVLRGAAATFECHTRHRNYGGDHIVLIGAVERYGYTDRSPLVFYRGCYVALGKGTRPLGI